MKRKNKIPTTKQPKQPNRVPQVKPVQEPIKFEFIYENWLKSYSEKDFTTYLVNSEMYAKSITYIFTVLIPKLSNEFKVGQNSSQWKHCHSVKDGRALERYEHAIKEIHNIDSEDLDLWEFGISGGLRLIGHLTAKNTVLPLLIDYHHLGYDSQKYNNKDTRKYGFCPVDTYLSK